MAVTEPVTQWCRYAGRLISMGTLAFAMGLFSPSLGLGQTDDPPFPGAERLAADDEFQRSQAVNAAKAAGSPAEYALTTFTASSFTTSASVDSVLAHLVPGPVESRGPMPVNPVLSCYEGERERGFCRGLVVDPDSLARSFLGSLDEDELSALSVAVGNELSGMAYREAFLAALDEVPPEGVEYALVVHEGPDGFPSFHELHRPYFDVSLLRWIDATRIRIIGPPFESG